MINILNQYFQICATTSARTSISVNVLYTLQTPHFAMLLNIIDDNLSSDRNALSSTIFVDYRISHSYHSALIINIP